MKPFYKTIVLMVALLFVFLLPAVRGAQPEKLKLFFFFSKSCHVCHDVRENFLPQVLKRFSGRIEVEYRDIAELENYQLLLGLRNERKITAEIRVPTVVVAESFLTGKGEITSKLADILDLELSSPFIRQTKLVYADLAKHFQGFTPATVIGAGLIDGINPCAFTVIVFFISFLALQGYGKKETVVIGGGFILSVFLTYLLVGFGLFSMFYGFKAVWIVRKVFNGVIGLFTVALGVLSVGDSIRYKRSGEFSDVFLQLPKTVKLQIHNVIGMHYRRSRQEAPAAEKLSLPRLLASAVATGFLVSLLEAVCTGQVYLPTITFVMKMSHLRLEAYGYLLLYNVVFVLPLVAVFLMAMFGAASADFSRFFKRHFLASKLLLAAVFFVLGGFLLWSA